MPDQKIIRVSAIIPTKERPAILARTLNSLAAQSVFPGEIIVIDGSRDDETAKQLQTLNFPPTASIVYAKTTTTGAAVQRIQGLSLAKSEMILLMDDDILFEEECIARLYNGFDQDERVGGVSSMITNQLYTKPGLLSRTMYRIISGEKRNTWAGMVIGPAWNLLPEDDPSLPEYVPCEWLNTTCTMYRKAALPHPLFPGTFKGYSMFEDVTLSVTVAQNWKLLNARTARIFHDSQTGDHKNRLIPLTEMEVINRHYVMTKVLGRRKIKDYSKLFLFELFNISTLFTSGSRMRLFPGIVIGKVKGYFKVLFS